MGDITDALIYTQIKNNLTTSNYSNYQNLLIINNTSNDTINNVLSETTLKKGCCAAKYSTEYPDKYETEVYMIDSEAPYRIQKVAFNTNLCDKVPDYVNGSEKCSKFKSLYCENSNYLYKNDNNTSPWNEYSKYCNNYTLKSNLSQDSLKNEVEIAKQNNPNFNPNPSGNTDPSRNTDSSGNTDPSGNKPPSSFSGIDQNTMMIGGVIFFSIIVIIIIVVVIMSRKKKSTNDTSLSNDNTSSFNNNQQYSDNQ